MLIPNGSKCAEKSKKCPHCGETKPLSEFHKNRSKPDGHTSWCGICHSESERKRRAEYSNGTREVHSGTTKRCPKCGETKPVNEFSTDRYSPDGRASWCKSCRSEYMHKKRTSDPEHHRKLRRESNYRTGKCIPLGENPNCPAYLGVHVAERVLSHVFEHVERMPFGNPGFDFICKRGYKIDVKSSTRLKNQPNSWLFAIRHNTTADYFLCLAFDNRESLNPEHIWLLPSSLVSDKSSIVISDSTVGRWDEYALHDKLEQVIACCDTIRAK